jgi:hypothetical protein
MSRDGSGVYSTPPGTTAITNTPILSTPYNTNVADVAQDLNMPRPIVAGGTGASNAHDAMVALGGEIAAQVVTNFDSDPLVPGSFSAAVGATGAPVAGHAFTGIIYGDPSTQTIEARDLGDGKVPGTMYVRSKADGVWGPWAQATATVNAAKVDRAGDTMTGDLTLSYANPTVVFNALAAGQYRTILSATASIARWQVILGDESPESGGNAGSNFRIGSYTDAGATLGVPLAIERRTGVVTTGGNLTVGPPGVASTIQANASSPLVVKGGAGFPLYLRSDQNVTIADIPAVPVNFGIGPVNMSSGAAATSPTTGALTVNGGVGVGGNVYAGGMVISSAARVTTPANGYATTQYISGSAGIWDIGCWPDGNFKFQDSIAGLVNFTIARGGAVGLTGPMTVNNYINAGAKYAMPPLFAQVNIGYHGSDDYGIALRSNSDTGYAQNFLNASNNSIGSISTDASSVHYNSASDGRLKQDLRPFDAGPIIDALQTYDFAWKSTGNRNHGVIAQEAIEIWPDAVTHNEKEDWWGIDYSRFVPLLLQEIKDLRARVKQLETAQ